MCNKTQKGDIVNLTQGYSTGASQSAQMAMGSGYSQTDAEDARQWSAQQAEIAFNRQKELMQMEMNYNAKQAQIAREWEENMANTVYTRSVANMKEAGINPILAANMGLSGASVGSGQSASISGASAPMAQGYMNTSSAWNTESHGNSSSWNNSENGLVTAMQALAKLAEGVIGGIQSGNTINLAIDTIEKTTNPIKNWNNKYENDKNIKKALNNPENFKNWLLNQLDPRASGLLSNIRQTDKNIERYKKGEKMKGWWEE